MKIHLLYSLNKLDQKAVPTHESNIFKVFNENFENKNSDMTDNDRPSINSSLSSEEKTFDNMQTYQKANKDLDQHQTNAASLIEESQIDEFINPVDKQIAAIFQMTLPSPSNLARSSNSASNTEDDNEEDDDQSNLEKESGERKPNSSIQDILASEKKSFTNSKKLISNTNNFDSASIDVSTSSSSSKLGIKRKT